MLIIASRLNNMAQLMSKADLAVIVAGRENKIHEERSKKIYVARLKRKQNVLRD